jgi:hypothetical protein
MMSTANKGVEYNSDIDFFRDGIQKCGKVFATAIFFYC